MIVRRAVEGLDDRLDGSSFIARNLKKVFPDHWSFMLGELAMYSFVLLILTGTFLAFFYVASPEQTTYSGSYAPLQGRSVSLAYDSVMRLSFDVRAGLVMRQTHHWSALVFMAAIVAHLIRVFFTGAFRKPREMSWLMGVGLITAGIGAGFTGYSSRTICCRVWVFGSRIRSRSRSRSSANGSPTCSSAGSSRATRCCHAY